MFDFNKYEISLFKSDYFSFFSYSNSMIEVQSKNTDHWWILKIIEPQVIKLYHKHNKSDYYHLQCYVKKPKQGLKAIKKHDSYVLKRKESAPSVRV